MAYNVNLTEKNYALGMCKAKKVSQKSHDPDHKVGAFIAYQNKSGELIEKGVGWNQNPMVRGSSFVVGKGIKATPDFYEDKPTKQAFILHAETHAVLNALVVPDTLIISVCFLTHTPCTQCAALLVAVGLSEIVLPQGEVFMNERYGQQQALEFMRKAGIKVTRVPVKIDA